MSPKDLAEEFESRDYEYWLEEIMSKIPENIDKREGSIIFDAVAPAAMVIAQQSLTMAMMVRETYVQTATGEFLDYRAIERGTNRYPATYTEVKAKFLDSDGNPINNVRIGDRFASIGETPIFYTVTKIDDDLTGQLKAEEAGSQSNAYIGQILPVTPNDQLSWAEIIEVTAPARDVETDDHLRNRLLSKNTWIAYGGNIADYLDMLSKIDEVGAGQIYPIWKGPGTVKLVILNNDLMPASQTLLKNVQEKIDPEDAETEGVGLAPIDHQVTVVAPEELKININTTLTIDNKSNAELIKTNIKKQLENYFKDLRKEWGIVNSTLGRGYSETIYRSKILANIMRTEGVYNAQLPKLNGKDEDIQLVFNNQTSQLPILGEVGLDVG